MRMRSEVKYSTGKWMQHRLHALLGGEHWASDEGLPALP